ASAAGSPAASGNPSSTADFGQRGSGQRANFAASGDAAQSGNFGAQRAQGAEGDRSAASGDGTQAAAWAQRAQNTDGDLSAARAAYGAGASTFAALGTATESGSLRQVEIGVRNDDYVQILSGLAAGEIVMYQNAAGTSSNSSGNMINRMLGGSGAMSFMGR
nr:hypothetical protein [Clostridia bacterium]